MRRYARLFFDLYGFPSDIPCYEKSKLLTSPYSKAKLYEEQIKNDVNDLFSYDHQYNESKFMPYIQPYEFESFLFVDAYCSALDLSDGDANLCKSLAEEIKKIALQFETPEHINNSPVTAPSKRIESLVPGFIKNKAGKSGFSWNIAKDVGVANIRLGCKHFNEWLSSIESYK
jgi:hypothetical protein